MNIVISAENLSKTYRLGQIGTGTFAHDLNMWWARIRGKSDSFLKIGEQDYGNHESARIWALNNVNFTVKQGEVLGIIGRNGAGKSTLLKILSRVTAPTAGRIKIKGRIASLLEVGTGFHPELTGRENIYLNGAILGMRRAEISGKFDEIVSFSEVERFIDTPVKRYSSGMYVRLAFAVAAHLDPEILVVDEVLAVGDAEFQKKCLGKMSDVAHHGRTVLFVSHNMAALQNICTRGLLLKAGAISFEGDIKSSIKAYLDENYQQKTADESLSSRMDRLGSGVMRFTKAVLLDKDGNHCKTVQTGAAAAIALEYEFPGGLTPMPAVIQLTIRNMDGQKLFICLSRNSYPGVIRLGKRGNIICRFPKLNLLPGIYSVDVWSKVGEVIADEILNACQVEVIEGDFFGTGRMNTGPEAKNGMVVEHFWELNKDGLS